MSGFFQWLSTLSPWLQIPLVIGAFLIVIALILFLIEIAPRKGAIYTYIRLAACVIGPVLILWLLQSYQWAIGRRRRARRGVLLPRSARQGRRRFVLPAGRIPRARAHPRCWSA